MDKMREEFEAWWISKNPNHTDVKSYWHETGYWVNSNSAYSNLDFAWECWQASRSAMCVELPENCKGMALTVSELHRELDRAGVSYK